jgi:hypothetical protein
MEEALQVRTQVAVQSSELGSTPEAVTAFL